MIRQQAIKRERRRRQRRAASGGPPVYARRKDDLKRIRRRALRALAVRISLVLAGLLMLSGVGSYLRTPYVRKPLHWSAAGVGRVVGIPRHVMVAALNDGLLRVYVDNRSMKVRHDWLRGGNPSAIDYEAELRRAGWSDARVHVVGSLFGVSKGPFAR